MPEAKSLLEDMAENACRSHRDGQRAHLPFHQIVTNTVAALRTTLAGHAGEAKQQADELLTIHGAACVMLATSQGDKFDAAREREKRIRADLIALMLLSTPSPEVAKKEPKRDAIGQIIGIDTAPTGDPR